TMIPNIVYDLRYATENNFTHQKLYKSGKQTFLRLPVVRALQEIQNDLAKRNYGLKLFDAYRPHTVTQKMWDLIHDEKYVADPSKGSGHNRGLAVDLTIINLKDGSALNMGTGFDNFTDTAHHNFKNLPPEILKSRTLLKETMEKHGFKALETEWWHYSWPNNRNYEVLDIDFRKLATTQ
ncbi:MAG: M15 family metallopeptidase, partial [Flavisolibacter sp.]|nr:M15 family metallopeptidase [Flavisolibacter sp.]